MLYELIAVVRPGNLTSIKEIARTTGQQILRDKGVIRGITNWGQFDLPRPTTKHQTQHHMGHYFIMQFDASIATQQEIKRTLSLDPRMVRHSVVKIGSKLGGKKDSIEDVSGIIPWNTHKDNSMQQMFMHDAEKSFLKNHENRMGSRMPFNVGT